MYWVMLPFEALASNVHFIRFADPPPGAGCDCTSHCSPVAIVPALGLTTKLASGVTKPTARFAERVVPPRVPVMVTLPDAAPATLTVKFALVDPDVTLTAAGTVTFALLLERPTVVPADGAGPEIVTVPVADPGAVIDDVDSVTDTRSIGAAFTVRLADRDPPKLPVIVTDPAPTPVTVKVADCKPSGMTTLTGTVAMLALLLVSETFAPPLPAARSSDAVP